MKTQKPGDPFTALLTQGSTVVLLLAAGWLVLVLAATVVEAAAGHRTSARGLALRLGCPPRWHAWLLALLVSVLVGAAPAQAADPAPADRPGPDPTRISGPLDGLALPDRVSTPPARSLRDGGSENFPAPARAQNAAPVSSVVRVRAGDCLWAISRRLLPAHAPRAVLARTTADLYARNRELIGPDPDLIHPGQLLSVGRTAQSSASHTYSEEP